MGPGSSKLKARAAISRFALEKKRPNGSVLEMSTQAMNKTRKDI